MSSVEEHLKISRHYLAEAFKLLERGDPFDAAEKVWVAVKHATTALAMRIFKGGRTPKGSFTEIICKTSISKSWSQRGRSI